MASQERAKTERTGAQICYGPEECHEKSVLLFEELGLPKGMLPLKDLIESGYVRETGYVWLKQKNPVQHYNKKIKRSVVYGTEITAYVEKYKMKKMTGVVAKEFMFSVPITEMSLDPSTNKIYFKSALGIGKSFPVSWFEEEGEDDDEVPPQLSVVT